MSTSEDHEMSIVGENAPLMQECTDDVCTRVHSPTPSGSTQVPTPPLRQNSNDSAELDLGNDNGSNSVVLRRARLIDEKFDNNYEKRIGNALGTLETEVPTSNATCTPQNRKSLKALPDGKTQFVRPPENSGNAPDSRDVSHMSSSELQVTDTTTTFEVKELIANFDSVAAGQYALTLNVKAAGTELSTFRLLARIWVLYTVNHMADTYYTSFDLSVKDAGTEWCKIKGSSQFEVRAHHKTALVKVSIFMDREYSGSQQDTLEVECLDLTPAELIPLDSVSAFSSSSVRPQPHHSINTRNTTNDRPGHNQRYSRDRGVVTRMAMSKDDKVFAALTVFDKKVMLQVWDASRIKTPGARASAPENVYKSARTAEVPCQYLYSQNAIHNGPGARDCPLELAISEDGGYVAVYEAPCVGDWRLGEKIRRSRLELLVFRNSSDTSVPMENLAADGSQRGLTSLALPVDLKRAVGYATFAAKSENHWRKLPTRFVFCDGLYLDIFELDGDKVVYTHSIPLTYFSSGMWRTVACELAVKSIVSNMFIWFSENGRHCTAWDLANGSNLGRFEIATALGDKSSKKPAVRVACSEKIIAIVGLDNSITTVDASTSIPIDRRVFDLSEYGIIENIAFPSFRSETLMVYFRQQGKDETEYEQTTKLVDAHCLDNEALALSTLLPSRSTALGYAGFDPKKDLCTFFQSEVDLIHFHIVSARAYDTTLEGADRRRDCEAPADCTYRLEITASKSRRSRHGKNNFKRQVKVWKVCTQECVFSFTPEPWELHASASGVILPSGDRFMVNAKWTIQIWSLPTADEPRCRLLFYWSNKPTGQQQAICGRSDTEIVLDHYRQFSAVQCHEYPRPPEQSRFDAAVTIPDMHGALVVKLPHSPMYHSEYQYVATHCIESIKLLALTYFYITSSNQESDMPEQQEDDRAVHAEALIDFVSEHINRYSLWETLLAPECPVDISAKFVASLLQNERCAWIPRTSCEKSPLQMAIDTGNSAVVRTLLDYCTDMARRCHPLYLAPIEQCFSELHRRYPELLSVALRNTSYIPAQAITFYREHVNSHHCGLDRVVHFLLYPLLGDRVRKARYCSTSSISCQLLEHKPLVEGKRTNTFEKAILPESPELLKLKGDLKVFLTPLPSLITLGSFSKFSKLEGKDYFDNTTLITILRFKDWQYGRIYWTIRICILLVFYGIFLATTLLQVYDSPEDIAATPSTLHLSSKWFSAMATGVGLGAFLWLFEVYQALRKYRHWIRFSSIYFYNVIHIYATTFAILCLVRTMFPPLWQQPEGEPHQFGMTPFAILTAYLHLMTETRTFRKFGTIFNTLALIINNVKSFFIVFVVAIFAFTHSLVNHFYAPGSKPVPTCSGDTCEKSEVFPREPFSAITATLFFLVGRYEPVSGDFKKPDDDFLFLIICFYLIVGLFMLTTLTALMTDTLSKAGKLVEQVWRMQLWQSLLEVEYVLNHFDRIPLLGRLGPVLQRWSFIQRRVQPVPTYLFYIASAREAESYKAELEKNR